jgi:uncharacterized phiE125 gp8 family phage protein
VRFLDNQRTEYRSLNRATDPAVEPVSVSEAKAHLRVDIDDDDAYIGTLITAARQWAEVYLDRSLVYTQWQMKLDMFPWEIEMPRPPMSQEGTTTAVSITYTMNDSLDTATLSTSEYRVDRASTPGVARTNYGGSWPSHLADQNSVTVTWWGGYGASGGDVPAAIRHAILMHVGHLYERRLAADTMASNEVPFGVKALLDSQKWGQYR